MDILEYSVFEDREGRKGTLRHPWETARAEIASFLLSRISFPKDFSIVDFGCGDGYSLRHIAHAIHSENCLGIDVSLSEKHISVINDAFKREKIKGQVSKDLSEAYRFSLVNKVGLVSFMDVLEHIMDDRSFLKESLSRCRLSRRSVVFITVPAFQSLFSSHDRYLGHCRRYSADMLTSLVLDAGLAISECGYMFSSLLVPRYLQCIKERLLKKENEEANLGNWNGGPFLTRSIHSALMTDFRICRMLRRIGINIPGLSLYCIAEIP